MNEWTAAFARRLRELGWIEGSKVAIEYRWAEGHNERFAEFSAEFVQLGVDVIVTFGAGVYAAKQATSVIPIVFPVATDPVGSGLVASLAQAGGQRHGAVYAERGPGWEAAWAFTRNGADHPSLSNYGKC
jgi:putative tryptophan/tyrosine transport system substrate-binding protein